MAKNYGVISLDIVISDDPNQKLLDWLRESIGHAFHLAAALKKIGDQHQGERTNMHIFQLDKIMCSCKT